MRRDDAIKMDCGTLVNPKNIVSVKQKVFDVEKRIYLYTSKSNWWDTEVTIKDITDEVGK